MKELSLGQRLKDEAIRMFSGVMVTAVMVFFSGILIAGGVTFKVNPDGSFDIYGSSVTIRNAYPAIDGELIKPQVVSIAEGEGYTEISYSLPEGSMVLQIRQAEGVVSIETSLEGDGISAATISPMARAEVVGANRFYRTPWAIADDAGIRNWPTDKKRERSNSMTGLVPDKGYTMVVATRDYRDYYSYADLFPAGLFHDKRCMDVTILTEEVHDVRLPAVYITEAETAFQAMRNEAVRVGELMQARYDTPQTYHWCSWYYAYYYLTEAMLFDFLAGFDTVEPRVPVQTIQIDVGYFPHVGDWLEPSKNFPNGLKPSVEKIKQDGYEAGIWIGPYMVGNRSRIYREHPDWVLRNNDGSMAHLLTFYEENRLWGAIDEEYYMLDTSHPEVMAYLRQVFRTFREMGFTFFKTDFMFWGAKASHQVKRHTPGKTSAQYQRELYEMIREEIGPDAFWLGCIANYAPMIGFVDAMRISWDIGANWNAANSFFREVQGQQFLNNVWWQNDPDAIILRSDYNHMAEHEIETLAMYMGMMGGAVNTSDLFHEIPEKFLDIFRFLEPSDEKKTASFPFLESPGKIDVLVRELREGSGWAVLFVNLGNTPVTGLFSIKSMTGVDRADCFDWNTEGYEKIGHMDEVVIQLGPRRSRLIYIAADGESPAGMNFAGRRISEQ
jgi:alpha-galactosidase